MILERKSEKIIIMKQNYWKVNSTERQSMEKDENESSENQGRNYFDQLRRRVIGGFHKARKK